MPNPKRFLPKPGRKKTVGKFRNVHQKNILNELSIGKPTGSAKGVSLEPGHIVRFTYMGDKVSTKRPMVLVLHPKWKGQLHGLNIDYIPERVLEQLWAMTKETLQGKIQKLVKLRLPLLKPDIGNPKSFYYSKLKRFLKSKLGGTSACYRTYNVGKVQSLKIIDYRFSDAVHSDIYQKAEDIDEKTTSTIESEYID